LRSIRWRRRLLWARRSSSRRRALYSDGSGQNLTGSVTWSSSSTAVATIASGGLATGQSAGSATITASSGSVTASGTLSVWPAVLLSLAVTPANPSFVLGTTQALVATGTYSDGSTLVLTSTATWTTADASIATVNIQGVVSSVALGSTTVTVFCAGETLTGGSSQSPPYGSGRVPHCAVSGSAPRGDWCSTCTTVLAPPFSWKDHVNCSGTLPGAWQFSPRVFTRLSVFPTDGRSSQEKTLARSGTDATPCSADGPSGCRIFPLVPRTPEDQATLTLRGLLHSQTLIPMARLSPGPRSREADSAFWTAAGRLQGPVEISVLRSQLFSSQSGSVDAM